MANREACELYIEQQIEESLEEGKKPYTIGNELSQWVWKLFRTRIPANTLRMRAVRKKEKDCTNVTKDSEDAHSRRADTFKSRAAGTGGARKGAGRPPKPLNVKDFMAEWEKVIADLTSAATKGLDLSDKETQLGLMIIQAGYRAVSKKLHPDIGGSHEDMVTLNTVKDKLINALS